ASVGIDDRNRHEVVLGHHLCDFFLVHRGGHRNYLGAHDVGDDRIGLGQKQLPHAHHAHQPAGPVDDVNVGYGLRAGAYLADMLQILLDGHAGADADVLHRHEAAGGVFGIVQEPLDYTGVLGRKQVDELLRLLRMDRADKVRQGVARHMLDNAPGQPTVHVVENAVLIEVLEML